MNDNYSKKVAIENATAVLISYSTHEINENTSIREISWLCVKVIEWTNEYNRLVPHNQINSCTKYCPIECHKRPGKLNIHRIPCDWTIPKKRKNK